MDNKAIRHKNIEHLVDLADGPTAFGRRVGRDPNQVSQWLGGKAIGDRLARNLEQSLGHPLGWLDRPQWPESTGGDNVHYLSSQPARLSAATVRNTTQAIRTFLSRRGLVYDPAEDAELFVAVYEEAALLPESPSHEDSMAFASVVADLVQRRTGAR